MQDIGFDYRYTRYPQDKDSLLSETLGIPGFLPAPPEEAAKYPETTFDANYLTKGYVEARPTEVNEGYGSLLHDDKLRSIPSLLRSLQRDIRKWEHERNTQVVHRSDGLETFLRRVVSTRDYKGGNVSSQKDRVKWKEEWVLKLADTTTPMNDIVYLDEIPYFQLKSMRSFTLCSLLEALSTSNCPLARANWFIKVTCLKHQVEEQAKLRYNIRGDNTLSTRSNSNVMHTTVPKTMMSQRGSLETKDKLYRIRNDWTLHLLDYLKSKAWDIPEYKLEKKTGYPAKVRPFTKIAKTTKKRPLTPSTKQPTPKPTINIDKLKQFKYACRLALWQFDEGLLNKTKFLDELLEILRSMRDPHTQRRKPGLPLSLCCCVVAFVLELLDSMSLRQIEKLWFICTKHLCQLFYTGSSYDDSLYFDPSFPPLCTLLELALHAANSIGKENIYKWEERIHGLKTRKDWNPIHRVMKGLSSNASSKVKLRNADHYLHNAPTSQILVSTNKKGEITLDFSRVRETKKLQPWNDPWVKLEHIPNTKSVYHLLANARRVKRA